MAKQVLPTNFVDDILAPSMNQKRKFTITALGDGTYEIEDVTDYTQTGSDYGAGQINATNQAVNESCDKADVIDSLDDILANQADGKITGAKAFGDFVSGNIRIVDILQCDITYGDDFIIGGGDSHTCTGTIKSNKKISDCKFKAFFICSNYGVPMSDPTFLVRGDYDVTVQQPVRNYTDIDHSVITTIGVICYK